MNLIVAVSLDYASGKNNKLLFRLPTDMAFFKEKTMGKVVVMGEKTYLSLPKRPLLNRINIVLSDNPNFVADGAIVVHILGDLFEELKKYRSEEIFVCGGASIYNLLMSYCNTAYVTKVEKIVDADTYINDIEKHGFVLKEISSKIEENNLTFTFQTYQNPNPIRF